MLDQPKLPSIALGKIYMLITVRPSGSTVLIGAVPFSNEVEIGLTLQIWGRLGKREPCWSSVCGRVLCPILLNLPKIHGGCHGRTLQGPAVSAVSYWTGLIYLLSGVGAGRSLHRATVALFGCQCDGASCGGVLNDAGHPGGLACLCI